MKEGISEDNRREAFKDFNGFLEFKSILKII
jgi:hypothetical protein